MKEKLSKISFYSEVSDFCRLKRTSHLETGHYVPQDKGFKFENMPPNIIFLTILRKSEEFATAEGDILYDVKTLPDLSMVEKDKAMLVGHERKSKESLKKENQRMMRLMLRMIIRFT